MSKSPSRWVASTLAGRVGVGAVAFAALANQVHATPVDATGFEEYLSDFVCDVADEDYSGAHYLEITLRNCGLVGRYQQEIADAINDSLHEIVDDSETQRQDWLNRSTAAAAACEQAQVLLDANQFVSAANVSVNAWGSIIMHGKECCVLTRPPYCIDKDWSGATAAIAVPFLILALLLIGALLASLRRKPHKEPAELGAGGPEEKGRAAPDGQKRRQLERQLHNEWSNNSPLRVLPHSRDFANSAASLFAALWESFNFQENSVVNQFEHLLSLLRSQVAMVADRAIGEGVQVQEGELLPEALGDLHAELLNGFCRWRKKFRNHPMTNMEVDESAEVVMPKMCGAKWEPISRAAGGANASEMSRQLAEISAFLLVWGEAGNVRFMPEVVYFLTELVLESDPAGEPHSLKALYQLDQKELDIVNLKSGLFLSRVIRPIYDMLFEEWYEKVDVNKENKKDVKKLKQGLEAFIPPHIANYDDWNEFVANPDKMVEGFFQTDGTPLFQHPHGQRFKQLAKVDWGLSLEARETKTHKELHSLWGVFAAIHRVILVHTVLFFGGVITVYDTKDIPDSPDGEWVLLGQARMVRYAALGLVVPIHALVWGIAQWQVTGPALRPNCYKCECFTRRFQYLQDLVMSFFQPVCGCPDSGERTVRCLLWKPWLIFFVIPAITYGMIRFQDGKNGDYDGDDVNYNLLIVHFAVSGYLCAHLLFVPNYRYTIFPFENLTHVPILLRIVRYIFWGTILGIKFFLGMVVARAVSDAVESLEISRPGMQSWKEITKVYFTSHWGATVLQWFIFWCTNFYLFFTDTALWYIAGCGILGVLTTLVQRHFAKNQDTCALVSFMGEDAIAKIPQRFSKKVLCYAPPGKDQSVSQKFPPIWDRICEYMRYEDKINSITMGNLSYDVEASGHQVYWEDLSQPVGHRRANATGSGTGTGTGTGPSEMLSSTGGGGERKRVRVPNIFKSNTCVEGCLKSYGCVPDQDWPSNTDIQWRITALARGLGLPMPRPYRCPYMPGLTVLIPHYGEAILMQKKELFLEGRNDIVPLIDWLTHKYGQEFDDFTTRMQARAARGEPWPVVGTEWDRYTEGQWTKVCNWAAMRQQTLFRTVAGMCYYHPAIQSHMELQGDRNCSLGKVWDASDCFTCIVSMQMYVFFDRVMAKHTDYMFEKFPRCLKVAYIDYDEKGQHAEKDNVHKGQKRRYYSCLIDRSCEKKKPKFRIELPGYPILGDGKGDNQNHAIPFMRGHYSQCIDANQGAYFEQMMLLPNALAEFRSKKRGDNGGKKIIGFPEHITSDIGSIGDFAASAEVAFGTILQRTYSVLGARMHYGHPDIMNKLFMMQQGGVSKATKTINLSEDIFAGMDFTLRGDGRSIKHCEYFNLAKGRDLGFNTVLGFFSKLSSGTGEQVLTRQVFRLGQVMHLPEALSFYYAHAGYYLTQFFVSWALPLLVFMWLLVLVSDCDDNFASVQQCDPELDVNAADVMAGLLATCYSWIMLLFIFATMFPLFAELWMQRNLGFAVFKVVQSYATMAPLLFVFQAKCIGHYVVNEFRYGGATYVATGRGLPTERRPFIGEPEARKRTVKCEPGDLRFDVDPSSGKVWTVEDGGQAKKLGVMPGHLVTKIDDLPFSKASLNRMMHGKQAYTIEIKASYLMLKKVGGLYLDYAVISYYDGAMLLFGVILVFLAGGLPSENVMSLIWMFISLALTIIAWLYGPFIFNPYQYESSHFWNDLRALLSFFLQDSGRHWVDWYDRTQLKAGHGLATTLVDITFFMFIFAVAAWYVTVNAKVQAFASVFSQYNLFGGANFLYVAVLIPPIIASFAFTLFVVILELIGGCSSTIQRGLEQRVAQLQEQLRRATAAGKEDEELEYPDAGASVGGKAEDVEVAAPKTGRKTTMALGESATRRLGCSVGIPLPLSAITVFIFDIVEAGFFLMEFYRVGWYKGLMAGLILKMFLLSAVLSLAEGVLVSRTFDKLIKCWEPLGLPLATWVRAHRMLRDILCALLIFLPQSILVLLNSMNQCLCPTCNCHQLCLYRDPGHIKRSEQELSSLIDDPQDDLATATAPSQTGMPTATTSGTNPSASSAAPQRSSKPRSPNAEHSMDFKDDKGDTILLTVNKEGGVDFYSKDVKTLKELTVVSANGRTLHVEGTPCGRWIGSWDVNTKAGEEEYAQRAVALFKGEPYQKGTAWWDFSSWFAPSEARPRV